MIVPRTCGLGARSSALRIWSRAIQERTVRHRIISTKAPAAPARAATAKATARAPVTAPTAATALQGSQLGLSKAKSLNVPLKLLPISVPGRAGIAIQTFFVDTPAGVSEVADRLWAQAPGSGLYADLEGTRLSRHGLLSLLILYSPLARQAFLLDIFTLKSAAFKTKGLRGFSIKQILQSNDYKKAFFDVRNDSDALFHQFGVALRNVEDIQLMENATRPYGPSRNHLHGLAKCLEIVLSSAEKKEWAKSKDAGKALFCPESGGSYAVFNKRPQSPEIMAYCVGDVYYLPRLREKHWKKLSKIWRKRVMEESKARVLQSQQKDYEPHSSKKSKSPWVDESSRAASCRPNGISIVKWNLSLGN
ncbi:3'-5' exonuclease [Apiospora marii]|uniref:3'-5' exonuclease n=1 Tax=Apiospora marii TaxID=335849 RepID=UPI003130ACEA